MLVYRMVKSISSKPLTEMAIPVRIVLKKFHFVSNFNRLSANFYHSALEFLIFGYGYLRGYGLLLLCLAHLTNRQHQLELLTKFLLVQQLAMKPKL